MRLDELETHLVDHFLSRSPSLTELQEKVESIRFHLRVDCPNEFRFKGALGKLQELMAFITPKIPEDPLEALKYVYDAIREDWSAYWETEDAQGIAALQDDLDMLRKLEPKFKALKEKEGEEEGEKNIYKQFREILKTTGTVSASLAAIRGKTTDKMRESMFNRMQDLFSNIDTLMAPEHFVFKEPGEKQPTITSDLEGLFTGGEK